MAQLYADENFNFKIVSELRKLGHDIVTAQEAGQAGQQIPDPDVLAFATSLGRAVLTHNRRDYVKLHKQTPKHGGIIVCTNDRDYAGVATRANESMAANQPLDNKLIRVNKPARP